jgi:formylglycine-generating enzyme required for sulfatase activity
MVVEFSVRYCLGIICSILFSFFISNFTNAQTKKEQIVILSSRFDSLSLDLKAFKDLSYIRIQSLNFKIDSLSQVRNRLRTDLKVFRMELEKSNKEISLLMFKNDSLAIIANQLTEQNEKMRNDLDSIIDIQTEFFNPIEPEMIYVQGGTFLMTDGENSEELSRPFFSMTVSSYSIGKHEVTQAQWRSVMGNNPSAFSGCDDCPVESVSWLDIRDFLRKLNALTGKNYRLPTRAEWEFAYHGGNKSKGYKYSGSNDINSVGWYGGNCTSTQRVGNKKPNELGVFDMTGNVSEMISDTHFWTRYLEDPMTKSTKGIMSQQVGTLGGAWYTSEYYCRTTFHLGCWIDFQGNGIGFRLAHSIDSEK